MITIYVQSDGQTEAQTYGEPCASVADARHTVTDEIVEDFDIVTLDELEDLSEARARIDVDGRFLAAYRARAAGADEFDTIAIVEEP